jgi:hypothetical protein
LTEKTTQRLLWQSPHISYEDIKTAARKRNQEEADAVAGMEGGDRRGADFLGFLSAFNTMSKTSLYAEVVLVTPDGKTLKGKSDTGLLGFDLNN